MVLFIQEYLQDSDEFIIKTLSRYLEITKNLNIDKYHNIDIANVKIVRGGKPYLSINDSPLPIKFNLSHSNNVMIIGFDSVEVGVDIEKIKPRDYQAIVKRENLQTPKDLEDFYDIWTRKEATIKYYGKTIADIPNQTDIANNLHILKGYSISIVPFDNLLLSILT